MITQIDHEVLGVSRLATQFRESPNLIAYILNLLLEANTLEQLFIDIANNRYLDTATGIQLDILGIIVGQPREVIDTILLTDDEYRLWLKARITKNSSGTSLEEIISQINFLIDTPQILIIDGDTKYSISIGKILTAEELIVFTSGILSKTAGVQVSYLTQYDYDNFFSIGSVPNGLGFGTVLDPLVGGKMGQTI